MSLRHHNNIRSVVAKLPLQLRLHVDIKIQHGSGYRRRYHHGKQRRDRPSPPQHRRPHQHAQKHRSMRSLRPAGRNIRVSAAHEWKQARSQFPPQRKHRIQPHRPPNRRRAPRKGDHHRDRQNHRQQHRRNRNIRIENRMPNLMRQHGCPAQIRQLRQSEPAAWPRQRRSTPPPVFPRPAPSSAQPRPAAQKSPSPSPPKLPAPTQTAPPA